MSLAQPAVALITVADVDAAPTVDAEAEDVEDQLLHLLATT